MEPWRDFFTAEVGAAAALAGLIFVSLSVNQARILQYAGLPERGLQALSSLALVFALASLALAPDLGPRSFGAAALLLVLLQTAILSWLQIKSYLAAPAVAMRRMLGSVLMGQVASWTLVIGSALLLIEDDWSGLAWYPPGVILAFAFAGAVSWVLLIEINR
jgi:hypothetical protein